MRPTDRKSSVLTTQSPSHTSQWGNRKFDPSALAMPKPRNRSSPKVAHVITSRTSTNMENLVTILQRVYFPPMREIAHQKCPLASFLGVITTAHSSGPRKTCQTTWLRTRMCVFGIRKQKFNIQKPPFWGPILMGQYFRPKRIITLSILTTQLP